MKLKVYAYSVMELGLKPVRKQYILRREQRRQATAPTPHT